MDTESEWMGRELNTDLRDKENKKKYIYIYSAVRRNNETKPKEKVKNDLSNAFFLHFYDT